MTDELTPETPVEPATTADQLNPRFVCLVGVLLLVIIAALTGLTLQYRRRAISAELQLHQANERLDEQDALLNTFLKLKPGQQIQIVTDGDDQATTSAGDQ